MNTYVVGTDGSATAQIAVAQAAELARACGARLHVVCAYSRRDSTSFDTGTSTVTISALSQAEQIAESAAAAHRSGGLDAVATVGEGKPADVLLETAREVDADVIVVGNRRMQGFSRVLGAVANEIVHRAPCHVFLVKTT